MSEVLLRTMAVGDVEPVTRLGLELGYPVDEVSVRRRILRYGGVDTHLLIVAERDREVVGWAHALERPLLQEPLHAELAGLVVDDSARGSGIATALVAAVTEWAVDRGYYGIWLHSRVDRPEAHEFYPALGFERIKTSHVYSLRLDEPQ